MATWQQKIWGKTPIVKVDRGAVILSFSLNFRSTSGLSFSIKSELEPLWIKEFQTMDSPYEPEPHHQEGGPVSREGWRMEKSGKPPPHSTLRGFGSNDCGFYSVDEHSSGPLGEGLQGWRLEERVGVKCRASGEMILWTCRLFLHVNLSRIQDGDGGGDVSSQSRYLRGRGPLRFRETAFQRFRRQHRASPTNLQLGLWRSRNGNLEVY